MCLVAQTSTKIICVQTSKCWSGLWRIILCSAARRIGTGTAGCAAVSWSATSRCRRAGCCSTTTRCRCAAARGPAAGSGWHCLRRAGKGGRGACTCTSACISLSAENHQASGCVDEPCGAGRRRASRTSATRSGNQRNERDRPIRCGRGGRGGWGLCGCNERRNRQRCRQESKGFHVSLLKRMKELSIMWSEFG